MSDLHIPTQLAICDKNILLLDDSQDTIDTVEGWFKERNLKLDTCMNVEEALKKIEAGKVDIFLCDLILKNIKPGLRGDSIVESVRKNNKSIFLAIYSAFINVELPEDRLEYLRDIGIGIHFKRDKTFIDDLDDEFYDFLIDGIESIKPNNYEKVVKSLIISDLKKLDENIMVPIPKFNKSIQVKELIQKIDSDHLEGILFAEKWIESLLY